jgi:Circadian oscillating protein COP23
MNKMKCNQIKKCLQRRNQQNYFGAWVFGSQGDCSQFYGRGVSKAFLLRKSLLNSSICLVWGFTLISVNGCNSSRQEGLRAVGEINVSGKTMADREPKFSTFAGKNGDNEPLMVIYMANDGKSHVWFTLRPLGIYKDGDERAIIVANRLEEYRKQRMLRLGWGELNDAKIICAYTQSKRDTCQLVVTLPSDVAYESVLHLLKCKIEQPDSPKCAQAIQS